MKRTPTKSYWVNILLIIIILFIVFAILYHFPETEIKHTSGFTLEKEGIISFSSPKYLHYKYDDMRSPLLEDAIKRLPVKGYVPIEYAYNIEGVSLNTFHRDITSSRSIFKTKYPVYTLILYKYDGPHISACLGSHATWPFVWSNVANISGRAGTAYIFDSDLLHAGLGEILGTKRQVSQYKLCHREDLAKLQHLKGIRVQKTGNGKSYYKTGLYRPIRKLSYYFEFPINYWFYPIMMRREPPNTAIGAIQSMIPIDFYNNV